MNKIEHVRSLRSTRGIIATALWLLIQVPALAQVDETWAIAEIGPQPLGTPMLLKPIKGDAQWVALVAGSHRWTLEPIAGDRGGPPQPPGKAPAGTLALLRYPTVKSGPAPTPEIRFSGRPRSFGPGTPTLRFRFGAADYEISVRDKNVWLSEGARRTKIGEASDDSERFRTQLLWAGDLDRDGRLDFIVREENGGYSDDLCFYLSSATHEDGEVAAKVACEDWSG